MGNIENELKDYILNEYKSIRDFTIKIEIPYSTVATIFNRGLDKASIESILKICEALNISIDELIRKQKIVRLQDPAPLPSLDLTHEESELIRKYRTLDDHGHRIVTYVLDEEYDRCSTIQEDTAPYTLCKPYYGPLAAAGRAVDSFSELMHGTMEVPDNDLSRHSDYLIGVSGDSMEPDFQDGDIVYVQKVDYRLSIGQVGIFQKDNGIYIKEVGENGLISRNQAYPPMVDDTEVICLGKVIGKVEK